MAFGVAALLVNRAMAVATGAVFASTDFDADAVTTLFTVIARVAAGAAGVVGCFQIAAALVGFETADFVRRAVEFTPTFRLIAAIAGEIAFLTEPTATRLATPARRNAGLTIGIAPLTGITLVDTRAFRPCAFLTGTAGGHADMTTTDLAVGAIGDHGAG